MEGDGVLQYLDGGRPCGIGVDFVLAFDAVDADSCVRYFLHVLPVCVKERRCFGSFSPFSFSPFSFSSFF